MLVADAIFRAAIFQCREQPFFERQPRASQLVQRAPMPPRLAFPALLECRERCAQFEIGPAASPLGPSHTAEVGSILMPAQR